MSAKLVVLALLALLIIGIVIFRYRAGVSTLHVDPHAAQEIEKAKQR
jgi:hypothetical protein